MKTKRGQKTKTQTKKAMRWLKGTETERKTEREIDREREREANAQNADEQETGRLLDCNAKRTETQRET